MTTGTWLITTLILISGIAILAAVVRTWYWKRGHGAGLRTRMILFGIGVAASLAATVSSYFLPPTSWPSTWTLIPAIIAGIGATLGLFRDKAERDRQLAETEHHSHE